LGGVDMPAARRQPVFCRKLRLGCAAKFGSAKNASFLPLGAAKPPTVKAGLALSLYTFSAGACTTPARAQHAEKRQRKKRARQETRHTRPYRHALAAEAPQVA